MIKKKRRNKKEQKRTTIIWSTLLIIFILLSGFMYHLTNGDFIFWIERKETYDVILDPGHGDYDPGCIYEELEEKDFNLKMAQQVQKHLEMKGLSVKLTRDDGPIEWEHYENADLRARVAQSVAHDPILFVSMHINSSPNPEGNGFEIYVSAFRNLSKEAAKNVYDNVMSLNYFQDRGIITSLERSLFVIDMNTKPAILIETGFLSNEYDRSILLNDTYLSQICDQIAQGIYDSVVESKEYKKRKM